MKPLRRATLLALAVLALPSAAGAADSLARIRNVYDARGSIPPCTFSVGELAAALHSVDTYGQQYFGDFTQAIDTALTQRASGACALGGTAAAPTPGRGVAPSLRLHLPVVTAATGAGIPLPLLALGILSLLGALAAVAGTTRRWLGRDPAPAAWRQLFSEASWRAGGLRRELSERRPRRPAG